MKLFALILTTFSLLGGTTALADIIVDDFESGLPAGTDGDGIDIGFYTFSGAGSSVSILTTDMPPDAVPGSTTGNHVLQIDATVTDYAGLIHGFENSAVDTWITQDWSAYEGLSFWLYGSNSGNVVFVDLLDNRNPGSTSDDAERFSVDVIDNFSGWQYFEIPFANFNRKEVGNGAPNDGFTLTEMHGWAFGVLADATLYIDDVGLYGEAQIPPLSVSFAAGNYDIAEGATGDIVVKLNRAMNAEDPAQVSVAYSTDPGNATPGRDYTPAAGTLVFFNGEATQQSFALETFDNNKYTGDRRVILRLSDPVGVAADSGVQAAGTLVDDDPFDPNLLDDFERRPWLWWSDDNVLLENLEIAEGDPDALPEQGAWEGVLQATTPVRVDIEVQGSICNRGRGDGVVPVILLSTDTFDATTVDHDSVSLGDARETHKDKKTGLAKRHAEDVDGDGDMDLVFHFRLAETGLSCDTDSAPFNGMTFDGQPITANGEGARFGRDFVIGRD